MNLLFYNSYQSDNEIFDNTEIFNNFKEPVNLDNSSIFNNDFNFDFENDKIHDTFLNDYDYDKENNNNIIKNTINENELDANKNEKKIIFTTTTSIINIEKNEQTSMFSNNKTSDSTKKDYISKVNNNAKLGRKKKNEIYDLDLDNVHTKKNPDNIKVKYKRTFFNSLIAYLNFKLKKSKNKKLKYLSFKKLNSDFIKSLKKDEIMKMLYSPASDVLSIEIAQKYKKLQKNHNKEIIKLIYQENEVDLINILDMLIKKLMEAFCGNTNDDLLLQNYRLDVSIKELSKKESKEYIELFQNEAINFEENFKKIFGRKSLKDK